MKNTSYTPFVYIILLSLGLSQCVYAADTSYVTIGNMVLAGERPIKQEAPQVALQQAGEQQQVEKDIRKVDLTIKPLTDFEKKEMTFSLFDKHGQATKFAQSILNQQGIEELHVLSGDANSRASTVLNRVNHTLTTPGHVVLARMLTETTADVEVIKQRQAFIQLLVNDPILLAQLEKALAKIKNAESTFLNFWKAQDPLYNQALNQVYFPTFLNKLNTSSVALEGLRHASYVVKSLGFMPPRLGMDIANSAGVLGMKRRIDNKSLWPLVYEAPIAGAKICIRGTIDQHKLTRTRNFDPYNPLGRTLSDQYENARTMGMSPLVSSLASYGWRLVVDAWWGFSIYKTVLSLAFDHKIATHIHTKVKAAADVMSGLQAITNVLKTNEVTQEFINQSALNLVCTNPDNISNQLGQLICLLGTNTLKGEVTEVALRGRVFAAHSLMTEAKQYLIPALEVAGEVDTYVSLAKLIKAHEGLANHFSFAQFVDSKTPYIALENAWNPLVNPEVAVPMTMALGRDSAIPNVILSGPHGGGKSTTMETVAYNILLAQTFGIAPAHALTLAPFTKLYTYMDIKQNREAGQSTFMAEALRVDQIKQALQNLTPNSRCFVMMDEVFKGTMEKQGGKQLYKFVKDVVEIPQALSMLATHFEHPTKVEQESNGKIVNYHVGIEELAEGNFKPTYKLASGINSWWFTDEQKRERYINWLTQKNLEQANQAAQV